MRKVVIRELAGLARGFMAVGDREVALACYELMEAVEHASERVVDQCGERILAIVLGAWETMPVWGEA